MASFTHGLLARRAVNRALLLDAEHKRLAVMNFRRGESLQPVSLASIDSLPRGVSYAPDILVAWPHRLRYAAGVLHK